MTRTGQEVSLAHRAVKNWRTVSFIVMGCLWILVSQAAASPLPDHPIPPPPDPLLKSNLICRYIYISYPNSGTDCLGDDLLVEIPAELETFMEDQANGIYAS